MTVNRPDMVEGKAKMDKTRCPDTTLDFMSTIYLKRSFDGLNKFFDLFLGFSKRIRDKIVILECSNLTCGLHNAIGVEFLHHGIFSHRVL